MLNLFIILFGKALSKLFRLLKLGDGSTWPGHIALGLNKNFIKQLLSNSKTKTIIIAGTNGKTTTASLIKTALKNNGKKVFLNKSGANLLNGIASSLIINSDLSGKLNHDFAIFELDENSLLPLLNQISPDYLILLNLFRDQLDRYGEVNIVASRWAIAVGKLTDQTSLILNADDPLIAFLSKNTNAMTSFFGVKESITENSSLDHAADSNHCPKCGTKLNYHTRTFSHLGDWYCNKCGLTRPKLELNNFPAYPLPGTYNKYNTHAAVLILRKIGLGEIDIEHSFQSFLPAFGRQEIVQHKNKNIQIFLSKNPTSFNQSFRTITELNGKTILLILNDRIPDGRDISWIWDTELQDAKNLKNIFIAGDRVYDMALRLEYEDCKNFQTFENTGEAIDKALGTLVDKETLFILPTYSAMLDVRKILTGKKIL